MTTERFATPVTAAQFPMSGTELSTFLDKAYAAHGTELNVTTVNGCLVLFTKGKKCGCSECVEKLEKVLSEFTYMFSSGMILCQKCGNKRCPHASSHRNVCTGSNASGQVPVLENAES